MMKDIFRTGIAALSIILLAAGPYRRLPLASNMEISDSGSSVYLTDCLTIR